MARISRVNPAAIASFNHIQSIWIPVWGPAAHVRSCLGVRNEKMAEGKTKVNQRTKQRSALTAAASLAAVTMSASAAHATEGYFQPGYSSLQKSVADAGVANPEDAMTTAENPAGLTSVDNEAEVDVSLFSPDRGFSVTGGPGFVPASGAKSGSNFFVIPGLAYSHALDANSAWGVAVYGNGGMNTSYATGLVNPACASVPGLRSTGVFCGGQTGVNLNQLFASVGYARKVGAWSFGIAPILALQMFKASGLAVFSPFSASPANLTNRGTDWSYGGGVRLGALWSVAPGFRLAVSGTTPIWMSRFNKYSGLFAGGGGFDIPASVTAGGAWDVSTQVTLMADYKHIFYSTVPSVGHSSSIPAPLGSSGGPGFGWKDVDAFAVGAEWRVSPTWTLRAGYAHNNDPIGPSDVTLNILAPGVVTDHIAAGFSYKVGARGTIDVAGVYVPSQSVSGIEVTPLGPNPGRTISLSMSQWDLTVGYRHHF
jgi:long-chain fatty acid transport protein